MSKNIRDIELRLYVAIIKKKSLPNNELGKWLFDFLWKYKKKLSVLTASESIILMNHYSNRVPKKILISERNITENKYYSDLRRILKKLDGI